MTATMDRRLGEFDTKVDRDLIFSQTVGRNTLGGATTRIGSANSARLTGSFYDVAANVTYVKATLDAKNLVSKVETRSDNPARANLTTETEYSNYADHAEVLTDIKTPGHIVRKQGGRTMFDLQVKTWETNNPYLVFPVPPNVKSAPPANSR